MMRISIKPSDYLVIVGYFVMVMGIGVWFRNRLTGTKDYFAGGNQIPWWLAGISHYMSSFSAFSFIAYAQTGYLYGWVSVTLFWVVVPACLAGALVFAKRWRRARVITPVQFLETRFSTFVQQLFAWAGIPMKIFDDALKVFATGLFVSVVAGMNIFAAISLCGAVMILYTFFGGLWALVVTDYVQFLMKALAILLMLPLAFVAAGGVGPAFRGLPEHFLRPVNGPYSWTYVLGFAVMMIVSYNASWSLAQKYYSVRDEREATKSAYLSMGLNLLGAPLMILPAIIGRHFLPDLVAQHRTSDTYVLLVIRLLPAGMVGIIMAAMFSATMAAVSGDFNAIASVLTQDVYRRLCATNREERHFLVVGRWITFGLGTITTALSLWVAVAHLESLFNLMVTVLGLFMAPTLLPLLAGLTVRRISKGGAIMGFVCGLSTGCGMALGKQLWPARTAVFGSLYDFEGITLLANTAMTIAGLIVGSYLFPMTAKTREQAEEFFARMDTPVIADTTSEGIASSVGGNSQTGPVLALATLGVGGLIGVAGLISGSEMALQLDSFVAIALILLGVTVYMRSRSAR